MHVALADADEGDGQLISTQLPPLLLKHRLPAAVLVHLEEPVLTASFPDGQLAQLLWPVLDANVLTGHA